MDRELSTDMCDMFPQARAEPTNDVSALVPPARGQEGVNEIIPARLTTKTEKRGLKPTQSELRDASIESRLTLSVLPRVAIGVVGSYRPCSPERNSERRFDHRGITSAGGGGDAPSVRFPQVKKENGAKGDSCWVGRLEPVSSLRVFKLQNCAAYVRSASKVSARGSSSAPEAKARKHWAGSCKVRLYFSVFLHNSIIRFFFMLTHHVAKTWSFLKGHGRAVHMSPSHTAAALAPHVLKLGTSKHLG